MDNNLILEDNDNLIFPSVNTKDIILDLPLDNIIQLITNAETIKLPIHEIYLYFLRTSLNEYNIDLNNQQSIEEFISAIEEVLSPSEVIELKRKQEFCLRSGNKFVISQGNLLPSADSLKVLVPQTFPSINVEIVNKDIPITNLTSLNEVRDEFLSESFGLKRVLKSNAVADILNLIQEEDLEKEYQFYLKIFDKFSLTSGTKIYSLNLFRLLMQYALNVDTLELKSIITKEMLEYEQ